MEASISPENHIFASYPKSIDFTGGHDVRPLIGGKATYAEIEKSIQAAQKSVHMAYWTLDPDLPTTGSVSAGTLSELMRSVLERGVEVRIVIADFDPVIGMMFHRDAWRSYRKLIAIADGLDDDRRALFSVMCSRHDMRWSPMGRTALQPFLRYKLRETVAEINGLDNAVQRRDYLANVPGLWPYIGFDGTSAHVKMVAFPDLFPAAHHEKLCVIDDAVAFLGGLDLSEKRQDGWDHENAFPWHDVACRLEGPVVSFFARHFRCRWNEERGDSLKFLKAAKAPAKVRPIPDGQQIPELPTDVPVCRPLAKGVEVKPMRTLSRQSRSWFSRSPRTQITEICENYLAVISTARDFLYIENQYIRSTRIAEALAARAKENEALELILVLPLMPEDAFVEDEPNIATRHGQYLREKNTDLLYEAFGSRLGIYAMQMPHEDRLPDPETADPSEIIRNTVYIHSKTLICDDEIAIIGSANLNDRSMRTDTETGIVWRGRDCVKRYRVMLWKHALDRDTSDWTTGHLEKWRSVARANAGGRAEERQGFIVPLPRRHLDAHARRSWLVPDELV